jgi:nucleoid-associated protein YgaU
MAAAKNEAAAPAPGAKSETPPAAPAPTAGIKNEASAPAAVAPAPAPAPAPRVVVGSVAVEDGGRLVATGAASPNALLRLYLNGAFIANVTTGSDGRWSLTVEHGMKGGAYAVRADQIDPAKGSVIARAEVPFDYPERLAEQDAPAERLASTPVAAPPRPPVAATEPSAEAAASTVTSPKPPVAAAEPQAAPSAPAAMSQKPPVMAAEPEAAPSAPLAEAPKLPAAAAASQPAASVAASPKPLETGSEQHPSSTAQTLAPTRPEVAPVPPTAASAQPEVAASADAPSSSSAATPLSPGGAPPQAVAGAHAPGDAANAVIRSVDTKKVVRGDSLWRISSHFYGSGLRYKQIYEANASQIRDPWLIYPGQIFVLPRETPF